MKALVSSALGVVSSIFLLSAAPAASAQTVAEIVRGYEDYPDLVLFCEDWATRNSANANEWRQAFQRCRDRVAEWASSELEAEYQRRSFLARPAEPGSECTGTFTHFTRYGYQIGGTDLTAIRVTGSYRLPSGAGRFSIIDDDGFFTIASVVSRWYSVGPNDAWQSFEQIDRAPNARDVPRSDLELVHAASVMGVRYYDHIQRTYSTPRAGQSAADFAAFRDQVTDRLRYMNAVAREVSGLLGSTDAERLRVEVINDIDGFLSRFGNPLSRAVYADLERPGGLYPLCQDGAANPVTGLLVCSRNFLDRTRRWDLSGAEGEPFCPQGVVIAPLPSLCDESAGAACQFGDPGTAR